MKTYRLIAIMVLMLVICACSGKNTASNMNVVYYPQCRQPLEEIKGSGSGSRVAQGASRGAVTGGTAGLISGALIGLIAGRPANVLTGVAVGATTGAVTGGIFGGGASSQRDENRLMAKYLDEIDGDISGLNLQTAAATVALQCYDKRFADLLRTIRDKNMTASSARARFAEIEAGRNEALQILGPAANKGANQPDEFQKAMNAANLTTIQPQRP